MSETNTNTTAQATVETNRFTVSPLTATERRTNREAAR